MSLAPRLLIFSALLGALASPVQAAAPVPVIFGSSWDAPVNTLQNIVNTYVGIPGAINV